MMTRLSPSVLLWLLLSGAYFVLAAPKISGTSQPTIFLSKRHNARLKYKRNSGLCETTPGVQQISGYIELNGNMSIWFWFFEARHHAKTAPFTLWLQGGPGCSSMIGLFLENGPCHVQPDGKTTKLNPYSWNTISNMIYIDQPVGTGFSFGTDTVNSTESAAMVLWEAFQVLFESGEFAKYSSREFIFATESYGGHFGPAFVTYTNQQNALIKARKSQAEKIVVSALMINDGWIDPLIQHQSYISFAANAPGYGPLVNKTVLNQIENAYYSQGGCKDLVEQCYQFKNTDSANSQADEICNKADAFCINNVIIPTVGTRDPNDLRQGNPPTFPPEYYLAYLQNPEILSAIGALTPYGECPDPPYELFVTTGDDARSWLPNLSALADSRMKILIWAGDADINCNWIGLHNVVSAMDWHGAARLKAAQFRNITLHGKPVASVQNVDNFSFARVFEAGHELPAYQPKVALEIFKQVIRKEQLHSV